MFGNPDADITHEELSEWQRYIASNVPTYMPEWNGRVDAIVRGVFGCLFGIRSLFPRLVMSLGSPEEGA